MSSHNANGNGLGKKIVKAIGIAFRICLDIVVTAILFFVLWEAGMNGELEVRGEMYHSPNVFRTGFDWTVDAMCRGFVNVFVPLFHLEFGAAAMAVLDNFVSWETFTFVMDTAVVAFITFIAYVLWRNWWLGGTVLLLGLLSLAWFVTMWALQLFGPLLVPLILSAGLVGVVMSGGWWAMKKVWKMAEDTDDDH